ncbi:hypothetical protein MKW94_001258 [Papaver nudicaule]|uniref:CHD3-type chromatin-remodeling factor PICKLE n=1 Tax=Papaver nudicaule TaxID=74823 RepID=A0AA41VK81_PAPNU|nr:hypothetical protein [Papaver nudicaule]
MSSSVERLRIRSGRRPSYNTDESDDEADFGQRYARTQEKPERFVTTDAKADSCQGCGESGDLLECETCTFAYHSKCLRPPLTSPPSSWKCPECVSPLNDIDKILDCEMRPTVAENSDASKLGSKQIFVKQYLVKWKGLSYLHCTWVPEEEFLKAFKAHPGLRTKIHNFNIKITTANNFEVAFPPEWTTVDRILASRWNGDEREFLVKWKELGYDECYWEVESDISAFQPEIDRFYRINSQSRDPSSSKQNSAICDAKEPKKKQKEFQHYERSPDFLTGGSLHPYQLEGLNFLRFSWSKQTHVILADEMGLGKTIQSIAFLGSLFEENLYPHLVVAPLSTLRNWEREFATWAPHMNVVMYVGSSAARSVIREYEFYFPKGQSKKLKKKKSGQVLSESKQDRIKFDVLLTSYEMINVDSASLKPIKWECVIVDEGHRLMNKDSKLFMSLKTYSSNHRTLLTGTPLQNNLDELFMLVHFLDAGKFSSLEEFQEFKDINQEEQIARLHKMLAPHLLRRVKKDVWKEMPPKNELILCVELSSKQKECYKSILKRNYEILTSKAGENISPIDEIMKLRKLCCHAYMLDGVEPDIKDADEAYRQLLDTSGKLHLLDKMMVKLKEEGHRVLIYTQFQHMLDLLENYCIYKKWLYERINGKESGAERQVRIDRFSAKNSSRFCFLLSSRAGGLGINLANADTVIIHDSDWNLNADLQAMARAHRLGQINKVMIYRLITRGTIEERMMQLTKNKVVLDPMVFYLEELDEIMGYGSKELFADESDEAGKAHQIHYDDAAIDRLLDRDQAGAEEATVDDVVDDGGFLNSIKVPNFDYIDEVQTAAAAKAEQKVAMLNMPAASNTETNFFWQDLLRYEEHKVEEFTAMGKGKRSRKQIVSVEEDDLCELEDACSDDEFDVTEADRVDSEMICAGTAAGKRPQSKKIACADASGPLHLMEGEGNSFRILGFNQSQRDVVQILMRFGVGDYKWVEYAPRLKQKSYKETKEDDGMRDIVEKVRKIETATKAIAVRVGTMNPKVGTNEVNITAILKKVKTLDNDIQHMKAAISGINSEIQESKQVKATESLWAIYKEEKKSLKESKTELVTTHGKLQDQLSAVTLASLTLFGLILTFNILFYSHIPLSGNKMIKTEYISRIILVVVYMLFMFFLVALVKEKSNSIKKQFEPLDVVFGELYYRFNGLSMNFYQREDDIVSKKGENWSPEAIETLESLHYKWAEKYDNLVDNKRISKLEVEEFGRSNWRKSTSTLLSDICLGGVVILTIVTVVFMINTCVYYHRL